MIEMKPLTKKDKEEIAQKIKLEEMTEIASRCFPDAKIRDDGTNLKVSFYIRSIITKLDWGNLYIETDKRFGNTITINSPILIQAAELLAKEYRERYKTEFNIKNQY
jgi:hypothetical protein